jgi:hypothetical protein
MSGKHRCEIYVAPTSEVGEDTGRRRYAVWCLECRVVLHEATTSASAWIDAHIRGEDVGYQRPMTDEERVLSSAVMAFRQSMAKLLREHFDKLT